MTTRTALLVDGENISAKHAAAIANLAGKHGNPCILRVYLDAQRGSDWHGVPGFQLIHAGSGKNASDILLSIDAMALALRDGLTSFVIASSDGDFSHVALRLREVGAAVTGIGEAKAPATFRQACETFVEIGQAPKMALVPKPACQHSLLDQQISAVISESCAGLTVTALNTEMRRRHATQIGSLPDKSWRAYFSARSGMYDLDPRGPNAQVRLKIGNAAQPAATGRTGKAG